MTLGFIATESVAKIIQDMNFRKDKDIRSITRSSIEQLVQQIEQHQVYTHILLDLEAIPGKSGGLFHLLSRLCRSTTIEFLVLLEGYPPDSRLARDLCELGIAEQNLLFSSSLSLKRRIYEIFCNQPAAQPPVEVSEAAPPVTEPPGSQISSEAASCIQSPSKAPESEQKKIRRAGFSFAALLTRFCKKQSAAAQLPTPEPLAKAPEPSHSNRLEQNMLAIRQSNFKSVKKIAVAGAGKRIGATTQALQLLLYLRAHNRRAALIEMHDRTCLQDYTEVYTDSVLEADSCTIHRNKIYLSADSLERAAQDFDFLILDYGRFRDCPLKEFLQADLSVVVCGIKPWEAKEINYTFRTDSNTIRYLFSFVPAADRNDVTAQMSSFSPHTFFAGYIPDMFQYSGDDELYQAILSECL